MLGLTLRNLWHRPGRAVLIVLAIAGILAEILILEAFMAGTYVQLRHAVLSRGGDVVVAQEGVRNFVAARSVLRQQARAEIEAVTGVAATHPIAVLSLVYEQGEKRMPIIVIVYDDTGGPVRLTDGAPPLGEGEIALDISIAKRFGILPGDTFTVSAYDFAVSGITQGEAAIMTPFAFMSFDTLIDFYFSSDVADDIAAFPLLSFLFVDAAPGVDPAALAAGIEAAVPDSTALLPTDLARNDENLGRELFAPILNVLLGLSYVAGALAIGLFMYAAVRGRLRMLGVMRALGFTLRHLVGATVGEAVLLTALAIPLGTFLALGLSSLIVWLDPVYLLPVTEPDALIRTTGVAIVLSVIGALVPLRALMRLDPATAFRG
ncbi:MAG: ABC transporter permease [Paracoccaceae bacterium]|jgi:putative ABC transport system permease protein|nr:ABC transporter permease [Paracoccaceae bacterium]MDP7186992.1 ABC transporter permease [Paracoccaceae bacterium]